MNDDGKVRDLACARALGYIHRRLDGETIEAEAAEWLDGHLVDCAECRQAEVELQQIQQALRGLSASPFPEDALDEVWDRTTRTSGRTGWIDWRAIAAAAVLALAFLGIWQTKDQFMPAGEVAVVEVDATDAELARAEAEARFVLNLTATALRRSEKAAIEEVMGKRVSPALQKIPLLLPGLPRRSGEARKNGEDDV
jgi:anti-sigma factor RsiW